MTDIPSSRPASDLVDRLRRQAFERESEALRNAVLDYFRQQTAAELSNLRATLKSELTHAVRDAVQASVTDQRVKEIVSQELTEPLVSSVAAEVAQKVGERLRTEVQLSENRILVSVRDEFFEKWTSAASKALNSGVVKAISGVAGDVAEQLKSEVQEAEERILESVRSEFLERWIEDAKGALNEGIDSAQKQIPNNNILLRWIQKVMKKWWRREENKPRQTAKDDGRRLWRQSGGILLASLGLLYLSLKLMAPEPTLEICKILPTSGLTSELLPAESISAKAVSPELPLLADSHLASWTRIMQSAKDDLVRVRFSNERYRKELIALLDTHSFEQQFSCWFMGAAGQSLEKLAGESMEKDQIKRELDRTFTQCFSQVQGLDEPRLAIFSAQATVRSAISSKLTNWSSFCPQERRPSSSDMSKVVADGMRGDATYWIMNLYLECKEDELTIDAASEVPEFLYLTYLALRELRPQ